MDKFLAAVQNPAVQKLLVGIICMALAVFVVMNPDNAQLNLLVAAVTGFLGGGAFIKRPGD